MRIWLGALWIWGVGGLEVHGIRSGRLVYKEVVEVWSNYKKSYLWWCWLLRLDPGAQGEHLTSQYSWVATWLLVTRVCLVYLMEERCYFRVIYWPLGGWWAGKGHGVIILNKSNNSVFLYLNIYLNRQAFDLIRASGVWMKPETLCHQASFSKF